MPDPAPTAVDLFCGAGGLSTGLKWAGFDVRWAIDDSEDACRTYSKNHTVPEVTKADLRDVTPPELDVDVVDLVAGGPPCPTFSTVGRVKLNSLEGRTPETDGRHQLWEEFLHVVDHYRPRAFLMENVRGMASATNDRGEDVLAIILDEIRKLDYRVDASVLDAANFGVPQRRERLFIVGNRLDRRNPDLEDWQTHREPDTDREREPRLLSEDEPRAGQRTLEEFGTNQSDTEDSTEAERRRPWITVAEAILDLPALSPAGSRSEDPHPPASADAYEVPPVTEYQQWARNVPDDSSWEEMPLENHEARFHNQTDLSIYKLLGEATGWKIADLSDELQPYRADVFADNYTKQSPTEPASTITAHLQKDGHMHIHPTEARSLTVREAARLQSFRDTFQFPVPRTAAFRQVGNAVPPRLASAIGAAIRETLLDNPSNQ